MFFGQFLVDEGVITPDALHQAIDWAQYDNARVGQLAVAMGVMTEAQVDMIQIEQRRSDARFLELAIELEILEPAQTQLLLREQKRKHKPLGEALVAVGQLDASELDDLLDRFHLSQLDLDAAQLELPIALSNEDLAPYLVEYFPKLFRRVTQLPLKLQAGREFNGRSNLPFRTRVRIDGDCPLEIGIAACPQLAAQLARGMSSPDAPSETREEILQCLAEFSDLFADAARRSIRRDGLHATRGACEADSLPKSGYWFPATTIIEGRGILVLAPA